MVQKSSNLKSSIIQGFGTLIVREFFLKLFSFLGQIVLARILAPADFGVYVILIFIIGLFGLFSDIGISQAIIQKKEDPTRRELSELFWIKIALSIVMIIIIWMISPYVKFFYSDFSDANVLMLRLFSVTLILTSIRIFPISLLERKIKYNLISIVDIIGVITYYLVSFVGAYLNYGVWSLIIGVIAKETIETIVIYLMQPFIPQIVTIRNNSKRMIKFGIFIQGNSFVMYLITSIIPVIGGRMSGPHAVGLLDFASNLASLPEVIAINFGRVAFAGYSRIQEQRELLFRSVNKSINMLSILIYFFPIVIFGFGEELILYIYTEKWESAVFPLYWFAAAAFFQPIIAATGQGILAIGRSLEIFRVTLFTAIAGWVAAITLVQLFGFTGIAITSFLISLTLSLLYIAIFRSFGFRLQFSGLFSKIVVFAGTLSVCLLINVIFPSNAITLMLKLFIAFGVYVFLLFLFSRIDVKEFIMLLRSLKR